MTKGRGFLAIVAAAFFLGGGAFAVEEDTEVWNLTNESELGFVHVAGNAASTTFQVKQANGATWSQNRLGLNFAFLRSVAAGVVTARSLGLTLRYDRKLSERFSLYAGPGIESNTFAGYNTRYLVDAGGRYLIVSSEATTFAAEAGYRFLREERVVPPSRTLHLGRVYVEYERRLQEMLTARLTAEFLPNFTDMNDFMANADVALIVRLSAIFSLKWSYALKFRNVPPGPGLQKLDSTLLGALLAKF